MRNTTYTYDAYNRLTAFDVVDAAAGRLIKQDWAYDALGRKGHTGGGGARYLGVTSAYVPNGQYKIAYDAASRLTREYYGSTYAFNRGYNYDDAGNRTSDAYGYGDWYYLGGFSTTYGAGNRETAVTDWMYPDDTPLSYDFKGNVTGREKLWDSAAFSYEWDAYDRLTTATQTGENWTVEFNYDALGRMLRREKSGAGAGDNVTFDYWLGLNKIAQESGGAGAEICVPDDETGATPAANGWYPRSNGSGEDQHIDYVNDNGRGRVLEITNDVGATATAKFIIGDTAAGTLNPNDDDFNTTRTVLSMWVKGDGTNYFNLAVLATTNLATRFLYLNATDGSDAKYAPPSTSYEFRIGSSWRAAQWQYLEVDLAARVDGLEPGETISRIDAIIPIVGRYLAIDDIKFGDGRLSRSWAQVPGAALGGYLGAQTGATGAVGVDPWDKYYYHFSDLGTVLATTNADGYTLGVYQPDFWGNYREVYGVRPDTMGLTWKFYDEDIQVYYYGYRWMDPERGRWLSEEPLGLDGPNLYEFCANAPLDYADLDGLAYFRKRALTGIWWLYPLSNGPLTFCNADVSHEQLFFEDGNLPGNIGYSREGEYIRDENPDLYCTKPHPGQYDDARMRQAVRNVPKGDYSLLGFGWGVKKNNCQDWSTRVRREYNRLEKAEEKLRKAEEKRRKREERKKRKKHWWQFW